MNNFPNDDLSFLCPDGMIEAVKQEIEPAARRFYEQYVDEYTKEAVLNRSLIIFAKLQETHYVVRSDLIYQELCFFYKKPI